MPSGSRNPKTMASPTRNWSDLPDLILLHLTSRLSSDLPSLYAFASVCRPWRSFLRRPSTTSLLRLHRPPLLLLLPGPPLLQSLTLPHSVHRAHIPPPSLLPHLHLAASYGLLISLSDDRRCIALSDPLTGARATTPDLPATATIHPFCYAALTASARTAPALLLFYSHNAFLCLRGRRWSTHSLLPSVHVSRVVSFKNQRILAINNSANKLLEFFNLGSGRDDEVRVQVSDVGGIDEGMTFDRLHFGPHLIECGDDLLLLLFVQEEERGDVIKVNSYRLDFQRMVWAEIDRLRDYALFVDCAGKCAVACYMPERWGGMSDCVYVTGPGTDTFFQLPIGGQTFPRYGDGSSAVCAKNITAPKWPSPIWIYPSMFF